MSERPTPLTDQLFEARREFFARAEPGPIWVLARRMERDRAELAQWLAVVLDQVDYTVGACGPTEMVAACLPTKVIEKARAALKAAGIDP